MVGLQIDQRNKTITIPNEFRVAIVEGQEFAALIAQPAWAKLLDRMERMVNGYLTSIRLCKSNDDRIVAALTQKWRVAEEIYQKFQELALLPIKLKLEVEAELKGLAAHELGEIEMDGNWQSHLSDDFDGEDVDDDLKEKEGI